MDESAMRALAKRFFDAVETGDIEAVGLIYAPDAVIWPSFTSQTMQAARLTVVPSRRTPVSTCCCVNPSAAICTRRWV